MIHRDADLVKHMDDHASSTDALTVCPLPLIMACLREDPCNYANGVYPKGAAIAVIDHGYFAMKAREIDRRCQASGPAPDDHAVEQTIDRCLMVDCVSVEGFHAALTSTLEFGSR